MKPWAMFAVSVILGGALLADCASSESGSAGGNGGSTGSEGSTSTSGTPGSTGSTGSTSTSGSTGSTSTSGSGGAGACGMLPTYDECEQCECDNHLAGCDTFGTLEEQNCACSAGAPCEAACMAYCGGGTFDTACEMCFIGLMDNAPCYQATYTACDMDPDCKAYTDALDASCANLP